MAKIRVVHIITELPIGGAEMMLYKLLSAINKSDFQSLVISLRDLGKVGPLIQDIGIDVEFLDVKGQLPNLTSLTKLWKIIQQFRPDLIQGWMYHGNLVAQLAAGLSVSKVPFLWNIRHSPYDLSSEKWMTDKIIRFGSYISQFPTAILYNSTVSLRLHKKIGYNTDKSYVIPNGFDTKYFVPSEGARMEVRRELGLAENAFLIGLVARYHPMKDHSNFLRALAFLIGESKDVHGVLIGDKVDSQNRELVDIASKLNIRQNVHFLGERSDIHRLTASLDLSVSASSFGEGFPNSIGEAMSCEVPCVVTDVGDSPFIIGKTGISVPPKKPIELSQALEKMINLDKDQFKKLKESARIRIEKEFSLDFITDQYCKLYRKLC